MNCTLQPTEFFSLKNELVLAVMCDFLTSHTLLFLAAHHHHHYHQHQQQRQHVEPQKPESSFLSDWR